MGEKWRRKGEKMGGKKTGVGGKWDLGEFWDFGGGQELGLGSPRLTNVAAAPGGTDFGGSWGLPQPGPAAPAAADAPGKRPGGLEGRPGGEENLGRGLRVGSEGPPVKMVLKSDWKLPPNHPTMPQRLLKHLRTP